MLISWLTKSFSIKLNLALYLNCHPPNRNDKFEFAQNVFRGFIGSTLLLEYLNEIFKFQFLPLEKFDFFYQSFQFHHSLNLQNH